MSIWDWTELSELSPPAAPEDLPSFRLSQLLSYPRRCLTQMCTFLTHSLTEQTYYASALNECTVVRTRLSPKAISQPSFSTASKVTLKLFQLKKSNNLNLYVIEYDTTGCVPNDLYLFLGFKNSAKRCGMSKKNPLQTTLEVWLRKWKWFMGDSKSVGVTLQNARRSLTQRCGILCVCLAGWGNVTILWGGRQAQTEIQKDESQTNKK